MYLQISDGYLPLHYLAASCPKGSPEMFNLILEYSKNRPLQKMIFEDERTGRADIEKYELDVAKQVKIMYETITYFNFRLDLFAKYPLWTI